MEALTGLLGEEDAALLAADAQSRAGADSVKRGAKLLEQQALSLKRIFQNVKPYLHSERINSDAAIVLREKIALARSVNSI